MIRRDSLLNLVGWCGLNLLIRGTYTFHWTYLPNSCRASVFSHTWHAQPCSWSLISWLLPSGAGFRFNKVILLLFLIPIFPPLWRRKSMVPSRNCSFKITGSVFTAFVAPNSKFLMRESGLHGLYTFSFFCSFLNMYKNICNWREPSC